MTKFMNVKYAKKTSMWPDESTTVVGAVKYSATSAAITKWLYRALIKYFKITYL
jgi:hypothetical protein